MKASLKKGLLGAAMIGAAVACGVVAAPYVDDYACRMQAYEFAKTDIARQYMGESFANAQRFCAPAVRVGFDILVGLAGLLVGFQTFGRLYEVGEKLIDGKEEKKRDVAHKDPRFYDIF